jgi:predicted aconitase
MINHCESDIPRVTQPSVARRQELEAEWSALGAEAGQLLDKDIPEFNKRLWEAGFGALWKN